MSKQKSELKILRRYASAGVINTAVGLGAIFALMWVGVAPALANVAGYLLSLGMAFLVAKKFVFQSEGHFAPESIRYLIAFAFSFFCNLAVLYASLNMLAWHPGMAQFAAVSTYVIVMYVLSRLFVFPGARAKTE